MDINSYTYIPFYSKIPLKWILNILDVSSYHFPAVQFLSHIISFSLCFGKILKLVFEILFFSSAPIFIIQCFYWVSIFGIHILFFISKTSLFSQKFPCLFTIKYPPNLIWTSVSLDRNVKSVLVICYCITVLPPI